MPQHYTVREANAILPQLARLLLEMQAGGRQLAALEGRKSSVEQKVKSNGFHNPLEDGAVSQARESLEATLQSGIEQLAEWNIVLKDLGRGLVDFPALREGRTVYLCWEMGEPEVAFWHEVADGFAGRRPLDDKIERG